MVLRSPYPHFDSQELWIIATVWLALLGVIAKEVVGHSTIAFIGSYNFTWAEPALAAAIGAVVTSLASRPPRSNLASVAAIIFGALSVFGFLRGLLLDPFQSFFSLRGSGVFAATFLLVAFVPSSPRLVSATSRAVGIAAAVLCLLVLLRLIFGISLFFQISPDPFIGFNDGERPLSAPGALTIGAAATLLLSRALRVAGRGMSRSLLMFLLALICLVLSGQRTAIVAGMAGILIVLTLEAGPERQLRFLAGLCVVIGLTSAGWALSVAGADLTSLTSVLPDAVARALERGEGNLNTRQLVWSALVEDIPHWSTVDQLVGLPAGTRPAILIAAKRAYWEHSMHSMYFGAIPMVGFAGLFAWLASTAWIASKGIALAIKSRSPMGVSPAVAAALSIMLAIFAYSYELRDAHGVFLMLAAGGIYCARLSPRSVKASERHRNELNR